MVDLRLLHIDSLRRTFDQSLMKIFQRVQEIWSGQESVTEGQTDGRTDEVHFYNPYSFFFFVLLQKKKKVGIKKKIYGC